MARTAYEEAIVGTFRVNALRTAHLIDDEFPTYAELAANEDAKTTFKQWSLAKDLYQHFGANHIPCDVANTIQDIQRDVERIRKSDLIVLDYNLRDGDTRMSVGLVRQLARTDHFNTIIVYTSEPDLNSVWLNFAAALRGDWQAREAIEDDLEGLEDAGLKLEAPSIEMIADYLSGRSVAVHHPTEWKAYGEVFEEAGVQKEARSALVSARIRREVRSMLKDDRETLEAEYASTEGRCRTGRPLWLQSGNCFITIVGKPKDSERSVEPAQLFEALDDALCDWRPNLLQLIISEIQNTLESGALATHELHLRDPQTQVSLCYFLLMALSGHQPPRETLDAPIHAVLDKLVEGVRQRLVTDPKLGKLGGDLLAEELVRLAMPDYPAGDAEAAKRRRQCIFEHARKMASVDAELDVQQALLKLNAFMSSEPFRGLLTTGTVFEHDASRWICMTPACDMVDRPPGNGQHWMQQLHPMKPMVAVRLEQKEPGKALKEAELSRSLFLNMDGDVSSFDVLPGAGGPSYEFIYVESGSLNLDDGRHRFRGYRLWRTAEEQALPTALTPVTFDVIGQVRPDYASRFLQQTGAWLSRIGVDFLRAAN